MAFRVGQRVVLVGWIPTHVNEWMEFGARYPEVGEVYTVRAIMPWRDTAVLLLKEVDNSHLGFELEPGIAQEHFRPVAERKADIRVSTDIKVGIDS